LKLTPRGIERGLPRRFEVKNNKWYPCPGWNRDPDQRKHRFDKWNKLKWDSIGRPDVYRLYWRTHPEAYAKMTGGKTPW
jgi:hypothetical protein